MTTTAQPQGTTPASEVFKRLASVLFEDLDILSKRDGEVFGELFCNREQAVLKFESIMSGSVAPPSYLILGGAGVGKSSFIRRILKNGQLLERYRLHPIVIDYRAAIPRSPVGCLRLFVESVIEYFRSVGRPINTIRDSADLTGSYMEIKFHLESISAKNPAKRILLVLDDFDYAEDDLVPLLEYFLPLTHSQLVSVVFSAREPLRARIETYDDRWARQYLRNNEIELPPLPVESVIAMRLAPLLERRDHHPLFAKFNSLLGRERAIWRVIRDLKIEGIDSLPTFQYPMTDLHNMFMQRITNGNLREIFDIAIDSMSFILENYSTLESRDEGGVERKIIGREGVMKLFVDRNDARFKIVDLHKERSRKRASLHYNLLEAVSLHPQVDAMLYRAMSRLGHVRNDVDKALIDLQDRQSRFVLPRASALSITGTRDGSAAHFELSEKGRYYLQIVEWDEYKNRFGAPGPSVREVL